MTTKLHDLVIVFECESDQEKCWPPYVMEMCMEEFAEKDIVPVNRSVLSVEQARSEISNSRAVLLVATPTLVDRLVLESPAFEDVLCRTVIVGDVCGTVASCEELPQSYQNYTKWRHCSFGETEEENKTSVLTIKHIVEGSPISMATQRLPNIVESPRPSPEQPTCQSEPKPRIRPRTNTCATGNSVVAVIPNTIHKFGEPVAIILKRNITDGHRDSIRIEIEGVEKEIKFKMLNVCTIRFKAPERPMDKENAVLKVFINDKPITEESEKVEMSLTYVKPEVSAFHCLPLLMSVFDVKTTEELDEILCKDFSDSCPKDKLLDTISMAVKQPEIQRTSEDFCPTLLHFAAYHGLDELASCLMESAYGPRAFMLENKFGHNPCDLADLSGRENLAEYFRSYMAMKTVTTSYVKMLQPEDLYMAPSNGAGHVQDTYSNIPETGYISMDNIKTSSRSPEDHYTTMDGYKSNLVHSMTPEEEERILGKRAFPVPETRKEASVNRSQSDLSHSRKSKLQPQKHSLDNEHERLRQTPSGFMGTKGTDNNALDPKVMGSTALAELEEIRQSVKEGEYTEDEALRLYRLWQEHYGEGTSSFKQRREALANLRDQYYENSKDVDKLKKCFDNAKKNKNQRKRIPSLKITGPIPPVPLRKNPSTPTTSTNSSVRGSDATSSSRSADSAANMEEVYTRRPSVPPVPCRLRQDGRSARNSLGLQPVPLPPPRGSEKPDRKEPRLPPKDYTKK